MVEEQSRDLADAMYSVESLEDWIRCPHCNSDDVNVLHFGQYNDLRPIVDCNDCDAAGFFD